MSKQVKAAYDYNANESGEISFKEGDIITVTAQHPSGWWTGELNGRKGTFPSNFTEAYTAPSIPPKPASRATYMAPAAGGAAPNPMAELQAKLNRRKDTPAAAEPAKPPVASKPAPKGPTRSVPSGGRMAQSMAPQSNKPPPPARKKIDTGAPSINSAKENLFAKGGAGGLFGAPAKKTAAPGVVKPATPTRGPAKPPVSPRKSVVAPAPRTTQSPRAAPKPAVPGPRAAPGRPTPAAAPARPAPAPPVSAAAPEKIMARATFDYNGTGAGSELLFTKGQEMVILQKDPSGWWEGDLNGTIGWFPAEFVEEFEEDKGPSVSELLNEVASTEKRLNTPTKAVRKGRRPPTRGKKAGSACRSKVRSETNDPPKDMSIPEPSATSMTSSGPTRAMSPAIGAGAVGNLRKTVAPTASPSAPANEQVDFRKNLRSTASPGSIQGINKDSSPSQPEKSVKSKFGGNAEFPPGSDSTPVKSSPFGAKVGKKTPSARPIEPEHDSTPVKSSPFGAKVGGGTKTKKTQSPRDMGATSTSNSAVQASLPAALGDYQSFCSFIESTMSKLNKERINGAASVSPQLNKANCSDFSFALCTVDGVKYSCGNNLSFSLQEAVFPFLYAIACSDIRNVDNLVSDVAYTPNNPMTLQNQKAQNPLCPAGAIAISSALYETQDVIDRSYEISQKISAFAGSGVGCDISNLFAAKKYNYTDKALTYWMQTNMPLVGDIEDTLDLYFQTRAMYTSCEQLAVMAATLANNGTCPVSRTSVVSSAVAGKTIEMMNKCKSPGVATLKLTACGGESGSLFAVIPGVGGLAVYGPLLSNKGISARGVRLLNEIAAQFKL